jgi:ACS family allantoate permease-like MFS transporter
MTSAGDISAAKDSIESGNMDKEEVQVPINHVENITGDQDLDKSHTGGSSEILFTEEEAARVKRKIDFIILPLLCGCYIFSVGSNYVKITDSY